MHSSAITEIKIGDRMVGAGHPCFVVAEVGINHNGDVAVARRLLDAAVDAGCDAIKFQKRTVDVVYSHEDLARPRESPYGKTNGDLKRALEFGFGAYSAVNDWCHEAGMPWFASCWDEQSVDFIEQFNPPCHKIASACLTDTRLLRHVWSKGRPIILSTGMSTVDEIDNAVNVLGREGLILLHSCSAYPAYYEELNLRAITTLRERYGVPVGYSGHETGLPASVAAIGLGACVIERHVTVDRAMWGTDQAASLEPNGLNKLVQYVREAERAMGDGVKRVMDRERPVMARLRRVGTSQGVPVV